MANGDFKDLPRRTGFIETTDHQPTDPPTHRPTNYLPTNSPTGYNQLTLKQRPDSKHVLYPKVLENFRNYLFHE